ncbi:hypothetical protein [Streptomyces millisiae]|uniref:Resolvase n=1 Tax=Streptomyces millisiae TaxID=3075542 RepID=A0ABU2LPU1_9ACTN|nr:hypothetical protein [Streptomyces sp. DSM 44918]MDT0319606.1 hypothetical protein [Streptomyces sp. DSM 44918]
MDTTRKRHPNAKDHLRARARELRRAGRTYDEIVAELGVSKSSVSLWVRDLPKPVASAERMRRMSEARWGPYRQRRALERQSLIERARTDVGRLTDRELFLIGVGLYWSEGAKSKAHRPQEYVAFINSDPGMIRVFLAWLRLMEVPDEQRGFRVMIHETADVAGAEQYWAGLVGIARDRLSKTTLKRHNPKTVRKNTGATYRGCLVVTVRQSAELYRRIEGAWTGIVLGTDSAS